MPEPPLPPGVPLFDADGALSREYLLHRGFCCRNGCRNCPYGFRQGDGEDPAVLRQSPKSGDERDRGRPDQAGL